MGLILNIDTATQHATVSIADNGKIIQSLTHPYQKDHAAFIHTAIQQLLISSNTSLNDIEAIAVVNGPGSYTGIRVGMASAKGLCFALKKPLITVSTLLLLAQSALEAGVDLGYLICPLLHARQAEVYGALYDNTLQEIIAPTVINLTHQESLEPFYSQFKDILFVSEDFSQYKNFLKYDQTYIKKINIIPAAMGMLSYKLFTNNKLSDIAYAEALYLKDVYFSAKK